ncbi:MAG TPA: hypothetical protein VG817_06310, partial [Gemmatimonadales bacterium]|nr:hypothetical protein [Gemmatimonadales bacterium]
MRRAVMVLSGVIALPLYGQAAVDTAGMREAAREFLAGCEDGARLWGQTLCGPMILVDPETRVAIATQQPESGGFRVQGELFAGVLPADVPLANTAIDWNGTRWSFVLAPLPTDPAQRRGLLFHEAFHRLQPALGLDGPDRLNT